MTEVYIVTVADVRCGEKYKFITLVIPDTDENKYVIENILRYENDFYPDYLDRDVGGDTMDLSKFVVDNKTYDYSKIELKRLVTIFN